MSQEQAGKERERQRRVEDMVMWSALLIYLLVWWHIPQRIMGEAFWYVGCVVGLPYVLGHIIAIRSRGHGYMSADSEAAPALFLFAFILAVVLFFSGIINDFSMWKHYILAIAASFFGGHVLALIYAAAVTFVLSTLFASHEK